MRLDNRRYFRRSVLAEFEVIEGSPGESIQLVGFNLSPGGVFLQSDLLYEVGETIWLSFSIPDVAMILRTRGKVVWVNKYPNENNPDDRAGMGVQFLDLSESEQAALGVSLCEC